MNVRPKLLSSLILLLAVAVQPTSAQPARDTAPGIGGPLPQVAYEKTTLPNGLELILIEDHRLPIVAVNIWYHVGPANEAPGLTGFAHLFEHMMFAATRHLPRGMADRLLEGAGATDSNGSTDYDRTNYYDTVPSNQLALALWVHATAWATCSTCSTRPRCRTSRTWCATSAARASRTAPTASSKKR